MSGKSRLRCAIYTRKSTEEGLEQEFNSLDAQREACAAFITSQIGLGWKLVPDHYADGGISGGTMERPALQRLLADIGDGKVDIVVVYKIDRLTRSLMDFARMVEIFDRHKVSFVSVTQQFNTTTSMGRLTLNVLLSFAQFEREVTAERIRDKIAASKKKGMWMGGTIPFGYRVESRKLIVNQVAAVEVRTIFDRYLELGSVPALAQELNGQRRDDDALPSLLHADTGQGRRRVAKTIGKGKLYYMLSNPIYVGRIRHGAEIYEGEHPAIIPDDIFSAVQNRLADQAPRQRGRSVQRDIHLLNGLLFDETGDRLSPIHATKAGKRYRYYISSRLKSGRREQQDGWRIPASEIESIALQELNKVLSDEVLLSEWMAATRRIDRIEPGLVKARQVGVALESAPASSKEVRTIIGVGIRRIDLAADRLCVAMDRNAITDWLMDLPSMLDDTRSVDIIGSGKNRRYGVAKKATEPIAIDDADYHIVNLPLSIRQRGVERRLVIEGQGSSHRRPDRPLIAMVARAHAYLEALTDGQGFGRKDVAERFSVHPEDVSRLLPLSFLSPRIVESILTGQQQPDLSVRHLTRNIDLPINWAEQGRLLGM
ncbi:MAG: recombinase family protein [Rhizobiaceae bacterium]|nr:recombinase family protein [Rhizobiaceae bacterium]